MIEIELHNVGVEAKSDYDEVITIKTEFYVDRTSISHSVRKKHMSSFRRMKKKELHNLMRSLNIHFRNPLVCMIQGNN